MTSSRRNPESRMAQVLDILLAIVATTALAGIVAINIIILALAILS